MTVTFAGFVFITVVLLLGVAYFVFTTRTRAALYSLLMCAIVIPAFAFQMLGQPFPIQYDWTGRYKRQMMSLVASEIVEGKAIYFWAKPYSSPDVIFSFSKPFELNEAEKTQSTKNRKGPTDIMFDAEGKTQMHARPQPEPPSKDQQ